MEGQKTNKVGSRCCPDILCLTWVEKEVICKEWQQSGLSKQRFCTMKNISVSTFAGWCAKFYSLPSQSTENLLMPVSVADIKDNTVIASTPIILEVSFPNAIEARIKATVGQFSYLLKELINATAVIR